MALLVGRPADGAADIAGVSGTRLRLMPLMARDEHDDRLPVRGRDDVARVRRDAGPLGQRAEVKRLEMRERRVLTLDVHEWRSRGHGLTIEDRSDLQLVPRGSPQLGELPRDIEHLARDGLVLLPRRARQRQPLRVEPPLSCEISLEERLSARTVAIRARSD